MSRLSRCFNLLNNIFFLFFFFFSFFFFVHLLNGKILFILCLVVVVVVVLRIVLFFCCCSHCCCCENARWLYVCFIPFTVIISNFPYFLILFQCLVVKIELRNKNTSKNWRCTEQFQDYMYRKWWALVVGNFINKMFKLHEESSGVSVKAKSVTRQSNLTGKKD